MVMVRFSDLKSMFLAQNPNATIKQIAGAVEVKYTPRGYCYTYRGTLAQIAKKLHLNCDEIKLHDRGNHGLDNLDLNERKITIDILGELTECLINNGYINFWFRYYCNLGERHKLKIYRDGNGYFFNLDTKKIRFAI